MLDTTFAIRPSLLSVSDQDIALRKSLVGLERVDIERIVALRAIVEPRAEQYTEAFFSRLASIAGASQLLARREALREAKVRKREHLIAMVSGTYDRHYVEQRIALASLYSAHQIEAKVFMGAFQNMLHSIGRDVLEQSHGDAAILIENYMSLTKLGYFDLSIITDVLVAERERTINHQQQAIRELSTPVLQLRKGLLILPIIGVLDSNRAKQMTDDLLRTIREKRCKFAVMDITGVAAVDSRVANHLIQTIAAARLMGSRVIITGLSADVAQALVALGIDLGEIDTTTDLEAGIEQAERSLGYRVLRAEP